MAWDNKYKLGILWQDIQHEQLIDQIELMIKARKQGMDDAVYQQSIEFLERYIRDHFAMETHYMKKYNYPKMKEHLKEHTSFNNEFLAFQYGCNTEERDCSRDLMMKMSKWVVQHILKIDKDLADFLKSKGVA